MLYVTKIGKTRTQPSRRRLIYDEVKQTSKKTSFGGDILRRKPGIINFAVYTNTPMFMLAFYM